MKEDGLPLLLKVHFPKIDGEEGVLLLLPNTNLPVIARLSFSVKICTNSLRIFVVYFLHPFNCKKTNNHFIYDKLPGQIHDFETELHAFTCHVF